MAPQAKRLSECPRCGGWTEAPSDDGLCEPCGEELEQDAMAQTLPAAELN